MARQVLMALGPIVLLLLAAAVSTTSPITAVLVVLLAAVFAGMLLLLERSLKAEHQQRWMLRSALESRITELERVVRAVGPEELQPRPLGTDLDSYRHIAQALNRIARIERTVGLDSYRDERTLKETSR